MATIAFGPATRKIFSCTRFTPSLFRSTFFVHKRKFSTLDKTRMRVDFRGHPSKENLSLFSRSLILGIESSCDDTGACVLSLKGEILGEALSTQLSTRYGGVIPTFAMTWHAKKIEGVVALALERAGVNFQDLTHIAVTNRPGLKGPLIVGTDYAKYLSMKHNIPMLPVHHMAAHALTARMETTDLKFPFLVLLISGGHCLLALCSSLHEFTLLGETIDDSPGEALDKCARMLGLHHLPGLRDVSGGRAIEVVARKSKNPRQLAVPMRQYRDCRFSFAGMKAQIYDTVRLAGLSPGEILPEDELTDICAGLQGLVLKHLAERIQRGCEYLDLKDKLPSHFVISGGVASNIALREGLTRLAEHFNMKTVFPPPRLCTDNGVMIAWAGLEALREGQVAVPPESVLEVEVQSRCPLGRSIHEEVLEANLKCKWIKL